MSQITNICEIFLALTLSKVPYGMISVYLHVILQILPGNLPAEIANVDATALRLAPRGETSSAARGLLCELSSAGTLLTILADKDLPTHELGVIQSEDCLLRILHGGELDDATSFAPPVGGGEDVRMGYVAASALHVILEIGPSDVPAKVANIRPMR